MTQPPFRPQQAGGAIGGFGKKLKTTKAFQSREAAELKKKQIDKQLFGKNLFGEKGQMRVKEKKTGFFKLKDEPEPKRTSQQTRQRQKSSPTQERAVGYKTQVDQQTNQIYQNPSVAVKVKHQPDIFLTQQEVSRLSSNMYYKPTGVMLPTNKPFLVGSTVLAVGLGGQTLVQIAPSLLPKDEQEKIELLPETDELEVQKVMEEKQTLTPEEISDLSVKTKPLIEDDTERKTNFN